MKYLVIDDEPQARKLIIAFMNDIGGHELVADLPDAVAATEMLQQKQVDCIFLDIQMPLLSGIDFLRCLANPPCVILTTAHADYALQGYELNVVDYLLKPISFSRFQKAVSKVGDRINSSTTMERATDYMFVKTGEGLLKIKFDDIVMVEGLENYVRIHLRSKVLIVPSTMKSMESQLPPIMFRRIHRSYIISVKHITAIAGKSIEMYGMKVPVGINYRKEVLRKIKVDLDAQK